MPHRSPLVEPSRATPHRNYGAITIFETVRVAYIQLCSATKVEALDGSTELGTRGKAVKDTKKEPSNPVSLDSRIFERLQVASHANGWTIDDTIRKALIMALDLWEFEDTPPVFAPIVDPRFISRKRFVHTP